MTDEEKKLMDEHGITFETKTVFHYQGYRYDRLQDAVNYAQKAGSSSLAPGNRSAK